jgi:hypothetical protein
MERENKNIKKNSLNHNVKFTGKSIYMIVAFVFVLFLEWQKSKTKPMQPVQLLSTWEKYPKLLTMHKNLWLIYHLINELCTAGGTAPMFNN